MTGARPRIVQYREAIYYWFIY